MEDLTAEPEIIPPPPSERPAFEIRNANTGQCWRIFVSGKVEGFGNDALIVNRIGPMVQLAYAQGRTGKPLTVT